MHLWILGNMGASTLRDVSLCNIELNLSNAIAFYPSNLAFPLCFEAVLVA